MRCPNCSFANPDGMRFCGRCGSFLENPRLGRQLPADPIPPQLISKILSQVKTLEGERRRVTVLFADISGYTTISEQMDPEDLASFANEVFRRLGSVIYGYEGTIDKYMGDCVMAIFGAPVAHEDDPERALRTALDMMCEVGAMSRPVSLHVGVNSGEVIAGRIGSDLKMDYTVMGDTVNLAERLTSAAPPGEIYVSSATHKLTKHVFDFEELGSLDLKGKREKTVAFRLRGLKARPGDARGVPGLTPHFLGRDNELSMLEQNLDRVKEGESRAVFVLGEAGVGKSRLIGEFKKCSEMHATWLEGRCSSYSTAAQFFPFVQLMKEALFNNTPDKKTDQTETGLDRIKSLFPERWEDVAASVARILPLRLETDLQDTNRYLDPRTLRVKTFVAVRDLLEALSRKRPVIVAIDDIHWADESSQDLMQFLIETTVESPVMLVGVTRPTSGSKWDSIQKEAIRKLPTKTDTIDLKRLSRQEMEELMDLLLEKPAMSPETRVGILERSGGSPFYLEEILKDLIEGNVLSKKDDRWVCQEGTGQLAIPETVEAVIASRIDKLSSRARSLARCASVLGTDFAYTDLGCVAGGGDTLEEELSELLSSGLMVRTDHGDAEYRFAHPLIQEVAYGSILKGSRRELHLKAAGCIERTDAEAADQNFGALGMHYEIGGDLLKAFSCFLQAGRKAKESYANGEAIANFGRALAIAEEADPGEGNAPDRISALIDRARVYRLSGETELALRDFEEALKLSRADGERKAEADCLIGLSQIYGWTSRFREMEEASAEALRLFRKLNDREGESESLSQLGYARQISGEYEEAIRLYKESLDVSTSIDSRLEQSNCLNNLGAAYCSQGDLEKGLLHFQRSLEIKREIGDLEGEAANLHNIGYINLTMGDTPLAMDFFRNSLSLKERIGDRAGAAVTLNSLGTVFIGTGDYAKGLDYCRRALGAREEVGDKRGQGYTLQNMSRVLTMTGPVHEAMETLKRALLIMEEVNDREGQALVLTSLGKVHADDQDWDRGREYFDRAKAIAEDIGTGRVLFKVESELALLALLCGRKSEAEPLIAAVESRTGESSSPEAKAVHLWLKAGRSAAEGDITEAVRYLSLASAAVQEGVDRAVAARWMYYIATLLRGAGASAEAETQFVRSAGIFGELGAELWLKRVRFASGGARVSKSQNQERR